MPFIARPFQHNTPQIQSLQIDTSPIERAGQSDAEAIKSVGKSIALILEKKQQRDEYTKLMDALSKLDAKPAIPAETTTTVTPINNTALDRAQSDGGGQGIGPAQLVPRLPPATVTQTTPGTPASAPYEGIANVYRRMPMADGSTGIKALLQEREKARTTEVERANIEARMAAQGTADRKVESQNTIAQILAGLKGRDTATREGTLAFKEEAERNKAPKTITSPTGVDNTATRVWNPDIQAFEVIDTGRKTSSEGNSGYGSLKDVAAGENQLARLLQAHPTIKGNYKVRENIDRVESVFANIKPGDALSPSQSAWVADSFQLTKDPKTGIKDVERTLPAKDQPLFRRGMAQLERLHSGGTGVDRQTINEMMVVLRAYKNIYQSESDDVREEFNKTSLRRTYNPDNVDPTGAIIRRSLSGTGTPPSEPRYGYKIQVNPSTGEWRQTRIK